MTRAMAMNLLVPLILVFILNSSSTTKLGDVRRIDSDSPDYDDFYEQLDTEYVQAFFKTTAAPTTIKLQETPEIPNQNLETPKAPSEQTEDIVKRLRCDNPWFWNTFKCVWLDLREKKRLPRTQKNARKAGIVIGIISLLVFLPLCWICVIALYFRSRVTKYSKLMDRYMKEYMPGSIILPNGQVKYYDPTPEEEEAFEDLIHAMSSPV